MSLDNIKIESIQLLQKKFVNDLLKDDNFSSLFNNQKEINKGITLGLKILENFLFNKTYEYDYYSSVGVTYFKQDVPFAVIAEIINFLQEEIVKYYSLIVDVHKIIDLYEISLNYISKGYFFASFDRFLNQLHTRNNKNNTREVEYLFNIYISWLKNIYINVKKTKKYDAMLSGESDFVQRLIKYKQKYPHFADKFEQVIQLYIRFYKQMLVLHYMLEKKQFIRAFELVQAIEIITVEIESSLGIINLLEVEDENRYDVLTGALSRKLMMPIIEKEIEILYLSDKPLILAMLDIDDFKVVNDTYGHVCGDEVLKSIVKICQNNLRTTDHIFRYGGEEFIILLNIANFDTAISIFEKIRKNIENSIVTCDGCDISVTVSIGVQKILNPKKDKLIDFIKIVDENLYSAKHNGKNMLFSRNFG